MRREKVKKVKNGERKMKMHDGAMKKMKKVSE